MLLVMPASFRQVIFHVENGGRQGGRRVVTHEYPKRDTPFAEDMGMQAQRWSFSGYLIYRPNNPMYDYVIQRARLVKALEDDDAGMLVHPVFAQGGVNVMVERYSMTESREKGGYTQFDMQFVQAGSPGNSQQFPDTAAAVSNNANTLDSTASQLLNSIPG